MIERDQGQLRSKNKPNTILFGAKSWGGASSGPHWKLQGVIGSQKNHILNAEGSGPDNEFREIYLSGQFYKGKYGKNSQNLDFFSFRKILP